MLRGTLNGGQRRKRTYNERSLQTPVMKCGPSQEHQADVSVMTEDVRNRCFNYAYYANCIFFFSRVNVQFFKPFVDDEEGAAEVGATVA